MRVRRVLIYDGPEDWIKETLRRSHIQDEYKCGKASITNLCVEVLDTGEAFDWKEESDGETKS